MTRAEKIANWMLENKATIRSTGEKFNLNKNVIHYVIHNELPTDNEKLYEKIIELLKYNFKNKHIRGGIATQKKFIQKIK